MSDTHLRFWLNIILMCVSMARVTGEDCLQSQNLPNKLSLLGTKLDLSHCNITKLQPSTFQTYLNLQILDLSYNALEELDFTVFQYHTVLQHLDISHNQLKTIHCNTLQYIKGITHLNMSYNHFQTTFLCKEFAALTKLRHLGLSARRMDRNDFLSLTHLELDTIFLDFAPLQLYEPGSLQVLNTEKLHVVLPQILTNSALLYNDFNISATLEISYIHCEERCALTVTDFNVLLQKSKVSKLILSDITLPWNVMGVILQISWHSSVQHLFIYRFSFIQNFYYMPFDFSEGSLKSLTIEDVIPQVFLHSSTEHPVTLFADMFIENLTISTAELSHFPCPKEHNIFQSLTLTNNKITDGIFRLCPTLHNIRFLNFQNNILERLSNIASMTSWMKSLKHLDVSRNRLYYDIGSTCEWSQSLVYLNLSRNKISDSIFDCLPTSLEVFVLSGNQIYSISKSIIRLQSLKELYLSSNQLSQIPDCLYFSKSLIYLNVDENFIQSPSKEKLSECQNVKKIVAGNNKYQCNCELKAFISTAEILRENLIGWPQAFICEYPQELKGLILKDFHPSEISCNVFILAGLLVGTVVLLLILMFFLCKYFDLPWYIRIILQWLRRKYRLKNSNHEEAMMGKCFHAFISYSQQDYEWVQNVLLPNLEKQDNSIKICHHVRDFIPGKTIIENIISSIEKSYKSIFVLSPHFVQSEWCHYELYFAQHSLFGKNSDNLILILLDPIPQYLIPNKYSQLKTIMKHRTYMEWPKEKGKHGLFWANLREAIQTNIPLEDEDIFILT